MHHKRDVRLSEDDLRTGKVSVSRLLGSLRTLVLNLLENRNGKNTAAQIDTFADKFHTLIQFMTQQMIYKKALVVDITEHSKAVI